MSGRTERDRFEAFYRDKWRGHQGRWIDRYPPEHVVYADAVYGRRNDAIVDAVGPLAGDVLDLGCGLGDVALTLGATGARVVAADVVWENARRTRENIGRTGPALVVQGAGERLPFRDRAFDVVILADVIEHVHSVDQTLGEVARVLRPGGRIVCVTPLRATLRALRGLDHTLLRLAHPVAAPRGGEEPKVHERFLSAAELRRALVAAGLRPIRFERVCFYPAPETAGAFGAVMTRIYRRGDAARFDRAATRATRVFSAVERLGLLNQKQLWVARR